MKKHKKLINDGKYLVLYQYLKQEQYIYTIDHIFHDFKNIDSMKIYCFLMYVIAQEENAQLHVAICDLLTYEPFFYERDSVIYWHIKRALEIDPENVMVKSWALDIYHISPDSPFSDQEMYEFALAVKEVRPDSEIAQEIISKA